MCKLSEIQNELKAPKGQYNEFGKYNYRSCEDILEAVKPLLSKYGMTLTLTDKIVLIGERFYVEATAKCFGEGEEHIVTAYAREPEVKKGMDESQITGTASSYARKYCLNGLFLIDDTKDADTNEHKKEIEAKSKEQPKAKAQEPKEKLQEPKADVKKAKNSERDKLSEEIVSLGNQLGKTMHEVAKEFGLNHSTTMDRLQAVRDELKNMIKEGLEA